MKIDIASLIKFTCLIKLIDLLEKNYSKKIQTSFEETEPKKVRTPVFNREKQLSRKK